MTTNVPSRPDEAMGLSGTAKATSALTARQLANRLRKVENDETTADHREGLHVGIDVTESCLDCRLDAFNMTPDERDTKKAWLHVGSASSEARMESARAWLSRTNRARQLLTFELHLDIAAFEAGRDDVPEGEADALTTLRADMAAFELGGTL